ncbi:FAD/NAD(P)-binding domain-containing protein [Linnemannia elongata AG-77]|uniref:FAD/NAD(P)-binding domain-containing protein n=1 Tax=Linnemannia elongata AG-77 TaxID=1314771 RepID=A0A197K409_9FUNG|nr:FAD/NAD(P)-binding domain-containing protein [Linnemannia elongata AG-77]
MATRTSGQQQSQPKVLIVGAGLGGVMLGILLEKADIPYTIVERSTTVKPLGSAMAIGGTLLGLFAQLGIFDEFVSLAKWFTQSSILNEAGETIVSTNYLPVQELTGYQGYIVARPRLYSLLIKQIPSHKIHFGKRILTVTEDKDDDKVHIQAADGTTYQGDILVGADGAYSAIRKRIYEKLKTEGTLPKADQEDLPFSCTCLVGQTDVLDVEEFPELKDDKCLFITNLGKEKPYSWVLFSTYDQRICFMVLHHLDRTTSRAAQEQRFRNSENSEWGPFAAQSMCDETREFPISIGTGKMTLGDLYERTPKELISKVMLEEKIFRTWHSGRTVLLGDACHKVHPAGGQGAVTAMHDAVALANLIYALPSTKLSDIQQAFTEYQAERLPLVTEAFNGSRALAKGMEKGLGGVIALWITRHIPQWLWKIFWTKRVKCRPQVAFLKEVESKGTSPPMVSFSYEKARAVYEKRQGDAAAAPVVI